MNMLDILEIEEANELINLETANQEVTGLEDEERFKIKNLDEANWALRKIAAYKKKQAEIDTLAKKEMERIQEWQRRETESIQKSVEFFENLLAEYFIQEKQKDSKFKLSTPYGKVTARKQQSKWIYEDEKLLKFLKQSGKTQFIRIKEEVNKAELKKATKVVGNKVVDENGEIIDGVQVVEQGEKIEVKVEV